MSLEKFALIVFLLIFSLVAGNTKENIEQHSQMIEINAMNYSCHGIGRKDFPPISSNVQYPEWMQQVCLEVVAHFTKFPYFANDGNGNVTYLSTLAATLSVCTMKFVSVIGTSIGYDVYGYAGSDLASLIHAGPIPWDDDVDMLISHKAQSEFIEAIHNFNTKSKTDGVPELVVHIGHNALKIYFDCETVVSTRLKWKWPFVDLGFYTLSHGVLQEVSPNGNSKRYDGITMKEHYKVGHFFPSELRYFGGVYLLFPNRYIAKNRYNFSRCFSSDHNHKLERATTSFEIDCCSMQRDFLFHKRGYVYERDGVEHTFLSSGAHNHVIKDQAV